MVSVSSVVGVGSSGTECTMARVVLLLGLYGVVVAGVEYPLDCLIFATGFEVGTAYTRRSECEIYGRNGVTLSEAWAKGMRTYHGFLSVQARGVLALPPELRRRLRLDVPGAQVEVTEREDGVLELRPQVPVQIGRAYV